MFDDGRIVVSDGKVDCALTGKRIHVSKAFRAEMQGMPTLFLHPDVVEYYRGHEDQLQERLQRVVLEASGLDLDRERLGLE